MIKDALGNAKYGFITVFSYLKNALIPKVFPKFIMHGTFWSDVLIGRIFYVMEK